MNLRQLVLQPPLHFVLITNRFRPLRTIYNGMYHLVLRTAAYALAAVPGIDAIFCRKNKFIGWLPGVSDLDLTVVLRADLSAKARQSTARSIRERLKLLKHLFPILGETLIFSHTEYQDFLKFGPCPINSLRHEIPLFVSRTFDRANIVAGHERHFSPEMLFHTAVERLVNICIPFYIEASINKSRWHRARLDRVLNQAATRLRVFHNKRPFVAKSSATVEEALLTVIDLAFRPRSELAVADRTADSCYKFGFETDHFQSMTVQNPFIPGEELRIIILKEGIQLADKLSSLRKLAADLAATDLTRIKRGHLKVLVANQQGWLSALEVFPLYLSAVTGRISEDATKTFAKRVYGHALCAAKSEPDAEKARLLLQKTYLPALSASKKWLGQSEFELPEERVSSVDSCLAFMRSEVVRI